MCRSRILLCTALAALAPAAGAQRLDPGFNGANSTVPFTTGAFLDLGSEDSDHAGVLIPRRTGGGLTMTLAGLQSGTPFPNYQIGLRRMFGVGASYSSTLPTNQVTTLSDGIVDGADAGSGICLLIESYDGFGLVSLARMDCYDDSGLRVSSAATPGPVDARAGALRERDSTMVIVGSFAPAPGSAAFKLYFERRAPASGALIGARVDHDLAFATPAPSVNRLAVAAMESDAQGRWLVAGRMTRASGASETEAFLARFNADFSLDTSFGNQGLVNLGFGGSGATRYDAEATDLAVLDNGMIVVAGLGCASVDCGTPENGVPRTRQALTALLLPSGARKQSTTSFVSTALAPRDIRVEATRTPFVPRNAGAGYVVAELQPDLTMLFSTYGESNGFVISQNAAFVRLRYTANDVAVPELSLADLATTRSSGRTRHYVAWTYLANTGNPTDTDLLMAELLPLVPFGDGFE